MSPEVGFGLGLLLGSVGWLIQAVVAMFVDDRRTEAYARDEFPEPVAEVTPLPGRRLAAVPEQRPAPYDVEAEGL